MRRDGVRIILRNPRFFNPRESVEKFDEVYVEAGCQNCDAIVEKYRQSGVNAQVVTAEATVASPATDLTSYEPPENPPDYFGHAPLNPHAQNGEPPAEEPEPPRRPKRARRQ